MIVSWRDRLRHTDVQDFSKIDSEGVQFESWRVLYSVYLSIQFARQLLAFGVIIEIDLSDLRTELIGPETKDKRQQ